MKNFNILGVHWKIQLLVAGGAFTEIWCRGVGGGAGLKKKVGRGGTWTVFRFTGRGAWQERGVVFLRGGWYPNAHYDL